MIAYQIILSPQFIYDSEQKAAEIDIFHDIKKGVRLKHVKTNDRSKPIISGRTSFGHIGTLLDNYPQTLDFQFTFLLIGGCHLCLIQLYSPKKIQ